MSDWRKSGRRSEEEEWGRGGGVRERRWNEGGEGGRTEEVAITLYVHVSSRWGGGFGSRDYRQTRSGSYGGGSSGYHYDRPSSNYDWWGH